MPEPRLTPRKLYKKIFLALMEIDDVLGALPALALERLFQAARPAETNSEMARRRYYFQAVFSSQIFMLALYLLFEFRAWDFRLLPYGLIAYFAAVHFFQYRPGDLRLQLAAGDDPKAQRRFAADLKITKLMLATWAMFFLSIQFFLPH